MSEIFDYSNMMAKTRGVQVILDRPRSMYYGLEAVNAFEQRFGCSVKEWLTAAAENGKEPKAEDVYFIAWLGFRSADRDLTLDQFTELVPWPALNAVFNGPVMQALVGYGIAEGNSPRAAVAERLPSSRSPGTLWGWLRRRLGRRPPRT